MKRLTSYYSETYAPSQTPRFSRLKVSASRLDELGLVRLIEPPSFDPRQLVGLHSEEYLRAFHQGTEPLASSQGIRWSVPIRNASYAMLSGQLAAVNHALTNRVCLNLACGFHHAIAERGSAYCALNGLALAAHAMPKLRVFVIDCDEHGGNGTESFTATMPNLTQASVFGTRFGCLGGERSWAYHVPGPNSFDRYLAALDEIRGLVEAQSPELLLYQAGVDCHEDDPKSLAKISTEQLFERDVRVFSIARDLDIPIVFVVAGGYQSAEILAELNANSVRAALQVFAN